MCSLFKIMRDAGFFKLLCVDTICRFIRIAHSDIGIWQPVINIRHSDTRLSKRSVKFHVLFVEIAICTKEFIILASEWPICFIR
ncbi:hypothetical protein [Labilibaculum euxinus]